MLCGGSVLGRRLLQALFDLYLPLFLLELFSEFLFGGKI
jgi:hypothetical protein